jgi:hypothetical protein
MEIPFIGAVGFPLVPSLPLGSGIFDMRERVRVNAVDLKKKRELLANYKT